MISIIDQNSCYLQVFIGSFEREMVVFAFEALLFEGRGERRNVVKRLDHRPGRRIFESIGTESKHNHGVRINSNSSSVLKVKGGMEGIVGAHVYRESTDWWNGNAGRGVTQYNHWYL